jgi:uncharacterized membrane protein
MMDFWKLVWAIVVAHFITALISVVLWFFLFQIVFADHETDYERRVRELREMGRSSQLYGQ